MSGQLMGKTSAKYTQLGQKLKAHRLVCGWKQKELLENLIYQPKPTVGFLSHVERGFKRPNPGLLKALADALGLTPGQSLEMLLAADYGSATEDAFSTKNLMLRTLLNILDALPNGQELIADTATEIFMNQVKELVLIWGEYSQGRSALYEGNVERAHRQLNQATTRVSDLQEVTEAYIEDAKGEIFYRQGAMIAAYDHFSLAFSHANAVHDPYLIGLTTIHLGDIGRVLGDWDNALHHYEEARNIFFNLNDIENMNLAQRNATIIYLFRGIMPAYEDSLTLGNIEKATIAKKHMVLKNDQLLSWEMSLAGKWKLAYELRAKNLQKALAGGSDTNKMFAHMFVGDSLLQLHQYEEAEYHFRQGLGYYSPSKAKVEYGYLLLGLARSLQGKGRRFWQSADRLFQDSIQTNVEVAFKVRVALARYYWGRFLLERANLQEREVQYRTVAHQLQLALQLFEEVDSPYYVIKCVLTLLELYLSQNNQGEFQALAKRCSDLLRRLPHSHKLKYQFTMLQAEMAILKGEAAQVVSAVVLAMESAMQFNSFIMQNFIERVQELGDYLLKRGQINTSVELFKGLHEGMKKNRKKKWYSQLDQERYDLTDWLSHYIDGKISQLVSS